MSLYGIPNCTRKKCAQLALPVRLLPIGIDDATCSRILNLKS